jgi:MoxR-like ATPase
MPILPEASFDSCLEKLKLLKPEIQKNIIGQENAIDLMISAFLAGGHGLLEGVPGLAKTMLVRTFATALDLSFNRIQFTPDLMPADILGFDMVNESTEKLSFDFVKGPIFAAVILADEINRTPPKTQSALLEAMQEKSITYAGKRYALPQPFFLMATQNPIEQAGTYSLPEAQMDRFLVYIKMQYPSEKDELAILSNTSSQHHQAINSILNLDESLTLQHLSAMVNLDSSLLEKINIIVRNTRPESSKVAQIKEAMEWGAGPRAGQALVVCSKALALLKGRFSVIPEDINALLEPVLAHRIKLNYRAESEGKTKEKLVDLLKI